MSKDIDVDRRRFFGTAAVTIAAQPRFTFGNPELLPRGWNEDVSAEGYRTYDILPDGKRFIALIPEDETTPHVNVVLNWFEEIKQRVPVK